MAKLAYADIIARDQRARALAELGLRIDLILLSIPLATRCLSAGVDREMRKRERPSDHAPVMTEIAD